MPSDPLFVQLAGCRREFFTMIAKIGRLAQQKANEADEEARPMTWDFAKAEEEREQSELSETLMKLGIQDHDAVARVLLREYVMTSKLPRSDGSRS